MPERLLGFAKTQSLFEKRDAKTLNFKVDTQRTFLYTRVADIKKAKYIKLIIKVDTKRTFLYTRVADIEKAKYIKLIIKVDTQRIFLYTRVADIKKAKTFIL